MKATGIFAGVCLVILFSGCGGGASSGAPESNPSVPSAKTLGVTPSSLQFSLNNQQSTVTVSGASGALSIRLSDPTLVAVSDVTNSSFRITPIAGGSSSATVTDASGATASVAVNTFMCVPPEPDWIRIYPQSSGTELSVTAGNIWTAVPDDGDPVNQEIPDFNVRLIGADSRVVTSAPFVVTNGPPPPGSRTLSTGYKYIYATASVPKLAAASVYTVQVADPSYVCLPPVVLGTFST